MSDYCVCCSSNIEWLEVHHYIFLEDIINRDSKELAEEVWEESIEELGEKAPDLKDLIRMIENIQYVYQPATVKRVSIHEAGHAVMDYHYGRKIQSIQIGGDIDAAGIVQSTNESDIVKKTGSTDSRNAKEMLMTEIKNTCHIMLAGVAAEHIYDGKKEILPTLGHGGDIDNCKNLLKAVFKFTCEDQEIYSVFFPETVKILEEKWKAVEALAQSLENKWSDDGAFIIGQEVERIIKKSLQTKD